MQNLSFLILVMDLAVVVAYYVACS